MDDIRKAIQERILILDGAMGTMLQRHGLQGNSEAFNISDAATIETIHREYIEAGADIITTNSFSANRISQHEYGQQDRAAEFAEAAARIARKAADNAPRKVWVAGSVGPTGKSLSLAQDINDPVSRPYSFDEMASAFEEQIRALIKGGADIILFETCFDALNTKAGIYALEHIPEAAGIPVMISASVSDRSGRTLTGQTIEAFYRSIQHIKPISFGLNCSLGASDLIPLIQEVSTWAECAVSCHPNAGLPNEMGEYDDTPQQTASAIGEMARNGFVNIVGGCCGTTPDHTKAEAEVVHGISPRQIPQKNSVLQVSGLESVAVDRSNNFTNVGERTNVAGSRKFAKLIAAGDYETGLQVAAQQIENGASIIDINMDDAMLDSTVEMEKFLRYVANDPAVAKAALMIDSSHWDTIATGLKNAQGKCIVNSISLKEGEDAFLAKAREIKELGAAVIVIAFDEEGQATTYDRKIEICERAYRLLTERAGFDPNDIIFDVNVLPVGTGIPEHARYGADFIEAVRWIKANLPGARTSGGISNLSFSFRGNNKVREAMHSVFLYHAIKAGLDMGIVNPGMLKVYDEIEPELLRCTEDVILDSDPGATERLIEKAQRVMAEADAKKEGAIQEAEASNTDLKVEERLIRALVKGDSSNLDSDIKECLNTYQKPVQVIDGPLMQGMAKVGQLFGDGKMFLPQVVKSAKTMKNAVEILQPFIEADAGESDVRRPKIVFATVKGDVHDIGKNITEIVMNCNGFEIIDLGVMVPKESILAKAEETKADLVGVSGLITPSLYQMEEICKEMSSRGMTVPLLVGGAAASALHTAVKLAPLYDHVFYGSDASASAVLASKLVSDREKTENDEHEKQEMLRQMYALSKEKKAEQSAAESFAASTYIKGSIFGNIPSKQLSVEEVMPYFDWNLFNAIWGIKPGKESMTELRKLRGDANDEIERLKNTEGCRITISARFDLCHSEADCIVSNDFRLPMFRQAGADGHSLSDYVPPKDYGFESQMGMFAVSVHPVQHPQGCSCHACSSDYGSMLARSVRLTLAEAASEWLSAQLQKVLDKIAADGGENADAASKAKIIKPAAGYASCPDHTLKRDILRMLPDAGKLQITLLDSCAMIPDATICGFIFAHQYAEYPEIRRISKESIDDYASKRGMTDTEKSQFLGHLL